MGGTSAGLNPPAGTWVNSADPAAGQSGFTAVRWGNIDNDSAMDTWQITGDNRLESTWNDVDEEAN